MSKATRRTFLKIVAGGVAVAGAGYVILGELHYLPVWLFPRGSKPQAQRLSASALRPDDFVSLNFDFENFYLDTSVNPATLNVAAYPAYITVIFPPQSLAEQAFYEVPASNFNQEDGEGNPLTSGEPATRQTLARERRQRLDR